MSNKQRYFIDQRVGCIAIRDRQHPEYDSDYQGLHSSTPDVVWYAHGYEEHGRWVISASDIEKAYVELKRLNEAAPVAVETNRQRALAWFNALEVEEQRALTTKYHSRTRLIGSLTGREIEQMWKKEDVSEPSAECNHDALIDTGVGYHQCQKCGMYKKDPSVADTDDLQTENKAMLQVLQAFKPHAEKYLSGKVHDPAVAMWADENTEQLFTNLLNALKTATV